MTDGNRNEDCEDCEDWSAYPMCPEHMAEEIAALRVAADKQRAIGAAEEKVPLMLVNGDVVRLQVQSVTGIDGEEGCEFRLVVNGVPSALGIIASTSTSAKSRNAGTAVSTTEFKDADGKPVTLDRLCKTEPEWAAARIRHYMEEAGKQKAASPGFTADELEAAAHICERTVGMSKTVRLASHFAEKVRTAQTEQTAKMPDGWPGATDLKLAAARSVLQACDAAFIDIQASNYVEDRCRKARALIGKLGSEYQHGACSVCGGGAADHRRLELRDDEGRRVTRFECKKVNREQE